MKSAIDPHKPCACVPWLGICWGTFRNVILWREVFGGVRRKTSARLCLYCRDWRVPTDVLLKFQPAFHILWAFLEKCGLEYEHSCEPNDFRWSHINHPRGIDFEIFQLGSGVGTCDWVDTCRECKLKPGRATENYKMQLRLGPAFPTKLQLLTEPFQWLSFILTQTKPATWWQPQLVWLYGCWRRFVPSKKFVEAERFVSKKHGTTSETRNLPLQIQMGWALIGTGLFF